MTCSHCAVLGLRREAFRAGDEGAPHRAAFGGSSDAEVDDLDEQHALVSQDEVGRLDVAVDNLGAVRGDQPAEGVADDARGDAGAE